MVLYVVPYFNCKLASTISTKTLALTQTQLVHPAFNLMPPSPLLSRAVFYSRSVRKKEFRIKAALRIKFDYLVVIDALMSC